MISRIFRGFDARDLTKPTPTCFSPQFTIPPGRKYGREFTSFDCLVKGGSKRSFVYFDASLPNKAPIYNLTLGLATSRLGRET